MLCRPNLAVGDVSAPMSSATAHAAVSPANDRPVDEGLDVFFAKSLKTGDTATAALIFLKPYPTPLGCKKGVQYSIALPIIHPPHYLLGYRFPI